MMYVNPGYNKELNQAIYKRVEVGLQLLLLPPIQGIHGLQ